MTRSRTPSYALVLSLILVVGGLSTARIQGEAAEIFAPPPGPGDLIQAINRYRGNNGLYAYTRNSKLMGIAKDQSNYMASTGSITHTGSGGTRPIDRAYAVGYGGGNTIWVSEIIYGGFQASEGDAISWWKTSQIHNDTMLSGQYVHIGAGVARSGQNNYYTVVVGVISGERADVGDSAPPSAPAEPEIIVPVEPAEPQEDGSILHTVQEGQSPWLIAYAYEVPLRDLLALNGLNLDSLLFEGQELLIRPAQETTPTATLPPTARVLSSPSPQSAPANTPVPTSTPDAASPVPEATDESGMTESGMSPSLLSLGVQGVGAAILAAGIVGFLLEQRSGSSHEEE